MLHFCNGHRAHQGGSFLECGLPEDQVGWEAKRPASLPWALTNILIAWGKVTIRGRWLLGDLLGALSSASVLH